MRNGTSSSWTSSTGAASTSGSTSTVTVMPGSTRNDLCRASPSTSTRPSPSRRSATVRDPTPSRPATNRSSRAPRWSSGTGASITAGVRSSCVRPSRSRTTPSTMNASARLKIGQWWMCRKSVTPPSRMRSTRFEQRAARQQADRRREVAGCARPSARRRRTSTRSRATVRTITISCCSVNWPNAMPVFLMRRRSKNGSSSTISPRSMVRVASDFVIWSATTATIATANSPTHSSSPARDGAGSRRLGQLVDRRTAAAHGRRAHRRSAHATHRTAYGSAARRSAEIGPPQDSHTP